MGFFRRFQMALRKAFEEGLKPLTDLRSEMKEEHKKKKKAAHAAKASMRQSRDASTSHSFRAPATTPSTRSVEPARYAAATTPTASSTSSRSSSLSNVSVRGDNKSTVSVKEESSTTGTSFRGDLDGEGENIEEEEAAPLTRSWIEELQGEIERDIKKKKPRRVRHDPWLPMTTLKKRTALMYTPHQARLNAAAAVELIKKNQIPSQESGAKSSTKSVMAMPLVHFETKAKRVTFSVKDRHKQSFDSVDINEQAKEREREKEKAKAKSKNKSKSNGKDCDDGKEKDTKDDGEKKTTKADENGNGKKSEKEAKKLDKNGNDKKGASEKEKKKKSDKDEDKNGGTKNGNGGQHDKGNGG